MTLYHPVFKELKIQDPHKNWRKALCLATKGEQEIFLWFAHEVLKLRVNLTILICFRQCFFANIHSYCCLNS